MLSAPQELSQATVEEQGYTRQSPHVIASRPVDVLKCQEIENGDGLPCVCWLPPNACTLAILPQQAGHHAAPQQQAKRLSDIDPASSQSMRSTKSFLYPVHLSIMTDHAACLAQLGSNDGFCYRCVMQEGSKLTGFNHIWWKFDTGVAGSAQHYMERKAKFISILQAPMLS